MIEINTQVFWKQKLRSGNLLKPATVLSVENSTALIQLQETGGKKRVPVGELTPVGDRYKGRSSVQRNPVHRG